MIKNERQYTVTKRQVENFAGALARLRAKPSGHAGVDPLLLKVEEDALRSQLAELRANLRAYDALRTRGRTVLKLSSLDDLPRALIQARISQGLSQKELAQRLKLKEQQIQRYEATNYASASLARLIRIGRALNLKVSAKAWTPASSGRSRGRS
jgi:ribosome-binding protein aMBF1 (putative translation factor)